MIECICNYCGKAFLAYPSQARHYCSRACYTKWRGENLRGELSPRWAGGNVTATCEVCGREFEIKRCRLGEARFCSHQCEGETRRTQIEIACEGCEVTFTGFPGRRFCSKSCSDQYLIGEHRYNWIGGPPEVICEWCGKTFRGWPSDGRSRRFCSRDCASKCLRGPKSSVWRGGTSFEPYSPEFDEEFKELIRDRDGYCCAICGEPANIVHHINYDKQDTRPENCVVLCRSCHARSNHDRATWEKCLVALIRKRAEEA